MPRLSRPALAAAPEWRALRATPRPEKDENNGSVTVQEKAKVISDHQRAKGDTGSPEVQVALLTARINGLNDHFKANVKDHHSRRGLLRMVSRRRKLLDYLRSRNADSYRSLIEKARIAQVWRRRCRTAHPTAFVRASRRTMRRNDPPLDPTSPPQRS
jgi:small subunit ribosomal protein S15